MARLLTCGYETGSIGEDGGTTSLNNIYSGAVVTGTPSARSGSYCFRATTSTGSNSRGGSRRLNLGSALSEIYGRVGFYPAIGIGTGDRVLSFHDSAGNIHLRLTLNGTTGLLTLYSGTSTTVLATASSPCLLNAWNLLECRCKIANSPDGIFQLWLNDTLVIDFSGDTLIAANADVQFIELCMWHEAAGLEGAYTAWDDLGFNDTAGSYQNGRCNDAAVLLLKPSGAGTTTQLTPSTGSNYACVDEVPPSTTDYVASSTQDQYDTYALEDVPAPYNAVNLVQPISYAALAAAGTGALRNVVRSGGTDYSDAADTSLGTSYIFVKGDVRYVDPADSNPWTTTKVNALEAGPKVR